MSILERLWNGQISIFERKCLQTKAYRSAIKRTADLDQQLRDLLGAGNHKLLEEFERASDEVWMLQEQDAFVVGVSFGMQILLEALHEHNFGAED